IETETCRDVYPEIEEKEGSTKMTAALPYQQQTVHVIFERKAQEIQTYAHRWFKSKNVSYDYDRIKLQSSPHQFQAHLPYNELIEVLDPKISSQMTKMTAKYQLPLGCSLFIRGNGEGLNWYKGIELSKVDENTYVFPWRGNFNDVRYKL